MRKPADAPPGLTVGPAKPIGERDPAAPDEAERPVVRVFVDPDLDGTEHGTLIREDGEDEARHARRAAALDRLFGKAR